MPNIDTHALAREFLDAYETGTVVPAPPSARYEDFDLTAAYAIETAFMRARIERGRKRAGLKVGYANKAVWRALKLETLVWGHMYDDTVHFAGGESAELALPYYRSPKVEPEIVLKLKHPIADGSDATAVLDAVEWLALGFEIIDCPFPDWQFKPTDFVAAFGLHLGLIVGEPVPVEPDAIPSLVAALPTFKVKLSKGGHLVEEGSGKNSLRSPALCVAELSSALIRRGGIDPLGAGDLISSGTLTTGQPAAKGDTWRAELDGLALPSLTLRLG